MDKTFSQSNYSEGFVLIDTKKINIDWDSYKKRNKIYKYIQDLRTITKIKEGMLNKKLWIDTKPLYIDTLSKSITLWKPINKNIVKYSPSKEVTM